MEPTPRILDVIQQSINGATTVSAPAGVEGVAVLIYNTSVAKPVWIGPHDRAATSTDMRIAPSDYLPIECAFDSSRPLRLTDNGAGPVTVTIMILG